MGQTKTDAELEMAAERARGDDERVRVIQCTRRFKSSWLELAEVLTRVERRQLWDKWGFKSFEEYTKKELHLRSSTVDKLTGSFSFLRARAPEVLRRDGVSAPIPSYQAIDFLRQAEDRDAPPATVDAIRKRVFEDSAGPAALKREYGDQVFPIDQKKRQSRDRVAVVNLAERLRTLLPAAKRSGASDALTRRLGEALDELIDALGEAKTHAA